MARVSETLTLIVKDVCENPVYLRWKETLGGWGYYLFDKRQVKTPNTDGGLLYQTPIDNIETAEAVYNVYQQNGREVWQLFADNIENYEVEVLQELPYSPTIQLYTGDGTTHTWQTVILTSYTLGITNDKTRQSVALTIQLPERYTLTN